MVKWEEKRFNQIKDQLNVYLKSIGFKEENINFIPISGLEGINLIEKSTIPELEWYQGNTLI